VSVSFVPLLFYEISKTIGFVLFRNEISKTVSFVGSRDLNEGRFSLSVSFVLL